MVKVSFRYNPELVTWIKSTGSGSIWNRDEKVWEVPESIVEELKAKAAQLGVELNIGGQAKTPVPVEGYGRQVEKMGYMEWDAQPKPRPQFEGADRPDGSQTTAARSGQLKEGEIRLRRSRDGRFVLISMNLIAFSSDVEDLMKGSKDSVKFRVLPPRPPQQDQD